MIILPDVRSAHLVKILVICSDGAADSSNSPFLKKQAIPSILFPVFTFTAVEVKQAGPVCPIPIIIQEAYCISIVYEYLLSIIVANTAGIVQSMLIVLS